MRGLFGLVSLLVAVGLVLWLYAQHNSAVSSRSSNVREQAAEIAGRDLNTGGAVTDSISVQLLTSKGNPDSILVTRIAPGSALAEKFGLQVNDTILQIGPFPIKGFSQISSDSDAKDFLLEAYRRQQELVIVRNGQQIKLPQAGATKKQDSADPLQQQIDAIPLRPGGS
jgi:hypothetical protein